MIIIDYSSHTSVDFCLLLRYELRTRKVLDFFEINDGFRGEFEKVKGMELWLARNLSM